MPYSRFIDYLESERRYSIHTVTAYKKDLDQFLVFCEQYYELSDIENASHQIIRSWIAQLSSDDISNRSIQRKISSLKSYYKYLLRSSVISVNPTVKIISPKVSKRLPVFVEQSSMKELLDGEYFSDDFSGKRDQLLVTLFYETGIRLSELVNLKTSDIDKSQKEFKVLGKRNKERIIPIGKELVNLIEDYLLMKNGLELECDAQVLLVTDRGKKLYSKFVYSKVNFYIGLVSTITKKSPHILRHTFATHMLNNGAQLNSIKELLGHSSLAATQVYTHNTIEKLKDIHNRTHPKG